MITFKKIDTRKLTKANVKKLTFDDLVADAIARKDKEAFEFLRQYTEDNEGKDPYTRQHIQTLRTEYLTRFCGYSGTPEKPNATTVFEYRCQLIDSVAHLFE